MDPDSAFQKMTRSLSFKFPSQLGGKKTENKRQPRKLDVDNWMKGRPGAGLHVKQEIPPDNIRMFNSVGDKKSLWANKVESHAKKQALNPFSDRFDKTLSRLSKDDPNYGRPDSSSQSAIRAKAGEAKMRGEICDVCDVIFTHGQRSKDGTAAIQFGPLFSIYNRINDKVVGLLIRARKRELLHFEGEMLYQRKDDEEWIVLTKNINTINAIFGRDSDVPGGGEVDPQVRANLIFEMESRKGSLSSVTSLPANLPHNTSFSAALLSQSALSAAGAPVLVAPAEHSSARAERKPETERTVQENRMTPEVGTPARQTPAEVRKLRPSSRGLKESFRKLVRPMIKKRESEQTQDDLSGEDNDSQYSTRRGLSRGGSRRSSGSSKSEIPQGSRWKKILGVSLAISRMAQMTNRSASSSRLNLSGSDSSAV